MNTKKNSSASAPATSTRSQRVACQICGYEGHVLVPHILAKHPEITPYDYILKYDAPVVSALGHSKMVDEGHPVLPRSIRTEPVWKLFGLPQWDDSQPTSRRFVMRDFAVFTDTPSHVPAIDPDYIFQEQVLRVLLLALQLPERNRLWLHGYAGTGKTQLVLQTAARLNYGVMRINGDVSLSRRQLLGDWVVRNGETTFQHGILPTAMRRGDILLIDEIDHFNPATLAVLRSVLEDPSTLLILENGAEVVKAHPAFRIVATANTTGAGDESGLFTTSRALSLADRQRFSLWSSVDYLDEATESAMLKKRFPKFDPAEIACFVKVATHIRSQHKAGTFEESFSPRELVNWAEKYVMTGDAAVAANITFIERYQSTATKTAVAELVRAAWADAEGAS